MDITADGQKFVLKDKITGKDFIKLQPPEVADQMTMMLKLALVSAVDVDKVLELPFQEFMGFMDKLNKHFGLDTKIDFLETK